MRRYTTLFVALGSAAIVCTAVVVANLMPTNTAPPAPILIPAISILARPGAIGGGIPSWGRSTHVTSHFYTTWREHPTLRSLCGKPKGREYRTRDGGWAQTFKRNGCVLRQAPVSVSLRATPTPTRRVTPRPPASPVSPVVPPTRLPTAIPPATPPPSVVPQPTSVASPLPTIAPSLDPQLHLLALMNQDRRAAGVAPLTLDATLSNGTGTCHGAQAHAAAEAQDGTIWHSSATHPQESWPSDICGNGYRTAGQNTGQTYGTVYEACNQVERLMMAEVPPNDGHRVNILNPLFRSVGLGIATNGQYWFTVETFTG